MYVCIYICTHTHIYPPIPDIYPIVPWIFIPSYPGYLSPRTLDIYPLVPWIFILSYPGYLSPRKTSVGYVSFREEYSFLLLFGGS